MLTILKLASFYRKWGIIMGKYFGTDGVRGVAGADLTCELAMKIGRGAAAVLTGSTGHRPRILIGKDTRQSGDMLEAALTAVCAAWARMWKVWAFCPRPLWPIWWVSTMPMPAS